MGLCKDKSKWAEQNPASAEEIMNLCKIKERNDTRSFPTGVCKDKRRWADRGVRPYGLEQNLCELKQL